MLAEHHSSPETPKWISTAESLNNIGIEDKAILQPIVKLLPSLGEDEAASLLETFAANSIKQSPQQAAWSVSVLSWLLVESPKGGQISPTIPKFWQLLLEIELGLAIDLTVPMAIQATDQQICWKGFSFLKKAIVDRPKGAFHFTRYLSEMVEALQPLVNRIYFLSTHELNLFENFIFLFKEAAVALQDDETSSFQLIDKVVPTILHILDCLDPRTGPLKDILNRPTSCSYSRIIELCSFVISNICGSTVACQDHIASHNPVKFIFPMVDSKNEDIAEVAWHTINWIIISDISKVDFIKIGGAERICQELSKPELFSRNIVYCARKLAMLPETRRKLIQENAIPSLLKMNRDSKKQIKPVFVSSFALAFVSLETSSPAVEEIRKHFLLETLENNVKHLYQVATKVCLKVLYVQLNHARLLLESSVYASQCFGVWWVLHLLWGQTLQRYNRDYRAMAVRDQIIPFLCKFVRDYTKPTEFLALMSLECLWLLSQDPALKSDLLSNGVANIFPELKKMFFVGSELGVHIVRNILCSPQDFLFPQTNTLRTITGNYVCKNTSREQFATLLDMCDLYQFSNMKYFFLSSLYCNDIETNDLIPIHDFQLRQTLASLKESKGLVTVVDAARLPTCFEVGLLKERCLNTFVEASKQKDVDRLTALTRILQITQQTDPPTG